MLFILGFVLVSVGVMSADSDCLIAPTILVVAGAILLTIYQRGENENE